MEKKISNLERLAEEFLKNVDDLSEEEVEKNFKKMDNLKDEIIDADASESTIEKLLAVYGWDFAFIRILLMQDKVSKLWDAVDRWGQDAKKYMLIMWHPNFRQWVAVANQDMVQQLAQKIPQVHDVLVEKFA